MHNQIFLGAKHSLPGRCSSRARSSRWLALTTLCLIALGLSPAAQAVSPPPGSGYADRNTAEGTNTLFSLTIGSSNTGNGFNALFNNTSGGGNTASGDSALWSNLTGDNNTATGLEVMMSNTTGGYNTATGYETLFFNTGGFDNAAYGVQALFFNSTGSANTAVGDDALFFNGTGSNNIALGFGAGFDLSKGDYNIYIGNAGIAVETGTIRIGDQVNHAAAFIAGINGVDMSAGNPVFIDANGQLGVGSASSLVGPTGPTGPAGAQGVKGDKGDTGAAGAAGPQGAKGDAGPQGAKGDTGAQGAKGDTGAQGLTGANGGVGPQGATGLQGSAGPTGAQGPMGLTGAMGPTGPEGVTLLNACSVDKMSHSAVWIGNGQAIDASGNIGATNENGALFFVSRTVTLTVFHARITDGTGSSATTFQVFTSSGVPVGSGPSATCVIPAGGSTATNNNASITLTQGLYAVKATSASGNLPGKTACWALGN